MTEYSPTVRTVENHGTAVRDLWDTQLVFATANNSGEAGAECDGDFFYTTQWNGSGFHKYNLDGTYVGPWSVGGVGSIRDLAYEPEEGYMYGGAGANTVWIMDFTAQTQIGTFNAPTAVRAIAYDPDFDGFWANNWSTNITLFDKDGVQLNSFPAGAYGNFYGFAHDQWNDGGPYLYGYSQTSSGAGNIIVQFEIATGLETGVTHDVTSLLFGAGIAGGLFSTPGIFGNTVSIGGNAQNDTYWVLELHPTGGGGGGGGGTVPANLLGYNIYRDDEFVDYVSREYLMYVDEGLIPACYDYAVTAVYDLTQYGFPGETGESMEEGPAVVCVDYCYELDFMEDFSLGNFDANNWDAQGNWTINGQAGHPAPAAEFTWDPIVTEYEYNLTSYPLCGQNLTEGRIWMDYDLRLVSYNNTGEEWLHVQVWNWSSQTWTSVKSYSNLDGNIAWTSEHLDIKAYSMGEVFKIRFQAMGLNSLDILSWYIDNVHVYRTCDGVTELEAEEVTDGVLLTWVPPAGGLIDEWIHWDDGVNANSIGTGAATTFDVAARWEPAQLVNYDGASVTEVSFFPAEEASDYSIRVWLGAGAANMVVDQPVTNPLIGQWNTVALTTPVAVDLSQELWVGYFVNTTTGFPAGCDDGPAIDGYGNMMNFGGWQTLLQINPELDYNWNVQVHLQTVSGDKMQLGSLPQQGNTSAGTISRNANYVPVNPVITHTTATRVLAGFNIYRVEEGGEYELLDFVADPAATEYLDEEAAPGFWCYKVTAVFQSDIDLCESDFMGAEEACAAVGIGEGATTTGSFSLYPNPARDLAVIETTSTLERVTVYNSIGQLVADEQVTGTRYELKTAQMPTGAYMVRVMTSEGTTSRVLNVQR
jgi:hypothetical protein